MVSPLPCGNRTPPTTGACMFSYSARFARFDLRPRRGAPPDGRTRQPRHRADRGGHRRHRHHRDDRGNLRRLRRGSATSATGAAGAVVTAAGTTGTATAATGTGRLRHRDRGAPGTTGRTGPGAGRARGMLPGWRRPGVAACRVAGCRGRDAGPAGVASGARPAGPRRTGCCRPAAGAAGRAWVPRVRDAGPGRAAGLDGCRRGRRCGRSRGSRAAGARATGRAAGASGRRQGPRPWRARRCLRPSGPASRPACRRRTTPAADARRVLPPSRTPI